MKITVSNYELTSDTIIAEISDGKQDCSHKIDRAEFENWLTDGTGFVDMGFTHHNGNVLQEVEIKEPIADYWLQGEEINNSPVLDHLQLFLTRDELSRTYVRASLLEQHLFDLFAEMEVVKRSEALSTVLEYGMISKEVGERSASLVFRNILKRA